MKKNNQIRNSIKNNIILGFKFNNKNEDIKKMQKTSYYTSRKIILDIINEILIKKTAESIKKNSEKDIALFFDKFSKKIIDLNNIELPKQKPINENCYKIEKEPVINKMDNWNRGQINKFLFKISKKNLRVRKLNSFGFKRRNTHKSISQNFITSNNLISKKNLKKKKKDNILLVDFSKINLKKMNKYENELREEKFGLKKIDDMFKKGVI